MLFLGSCDMATTARHTTRLGQVWREVQAEDLALVALEAHAQLDAREPTRPVKLHLVQLHPGEAGKCVRLRFRRCEAGR